MFCVTDQYQEWLSCTTRELLMEKKGRERDTHAVTVTETDRERDTHRERE